jgi:LysM repeat protein
MRRFFVLLSWMLVVCGATQNVAAQDSITTPTGDASRTRIPTVQSHDPVTSREVRDLRALVEKQSKQIEALSEQLGKLNQSLEAKGLAPAAPATNHSPAIPTAPTAAAEFSPDVPKAEAADGKRHVVVKGETLTSIAKHYNMPLAELQKANKEVDERKLQIGHTLTIPTAKPTETATDKKETP